MNHRAELPLEERDRRYRIIRDAMKRRGLDCLILWGNGGHFEARSANIRYISQIGGAGEDAYAIFPLEGSPTVLTWSSGAHLDEWLQSQTWVSDVRPGRKPGYAHNIIERIKELKLDRGSFGIVATLHNYHMPFPDYLKLIEAFPDARFGDATDLLDEIRAVKSAVEIKLIEKASEIGDEAIDTMALTARAGVRENVVYAKMVSTILETDGAEMPSMFLWDCGRPQRALRLTYTRAKVLAAGDIICSEFSPRYQGYYGHFSWPLVVGENKEYEDLFEAAKASYFSGLEALRPGISGEDLWTAFERPLKARGFAWPHGPYFHGIGLSWDPPRRDTPMIKEGMAVCFEPGAASPDGKKGLHIGDTVMVTRDGCRRLGRHPIALIRV
jgi:Xaa-Pro aminopeptidase